MRARHFIYVLTAALISLFAFVASDESSSQESPVQETYDLILESTTSISPVESSCHLPRPTNYSAPARTNTNARRDNYSHSSTSLSVIRSGKIININTLAVLYIDFTSCIRSGIKEPDTWFISLNKFLN